ncbi:MAG: 50S ribosomal protein L11 methyltransferase [Alphaproteobacteria bacterium]
MTATNGAAARLAAARGTLANTDVMRRPEGALLARAFAAIDAGDSAGAEAALIDAGDAAPATVLLMRGLLEQAENRAAAARATLGRVPVGNDVPYDVLCLCGDALLELGEPDAAIAAYDMAITGAPHAALAFLRRGQARALAGDVTGAIEDLLRATLLQPTLDDAHCALGDEYRAASMTDAAYASYRRALAIDPDHAAAHAGLDTVLAQVIPHWHAAMLNDAGRTEAFEGAIRRAVRPGMRVLDIGTGTGLLAMMAARAGAGHVTACESVGPLAEAAREIIALNGLTDRITVIHAASADLVIDQDMSARAELLIGEIVDAGLLCERIIETFADARSRLLTPDAAIIPRGATVYAVPVESVQIAAEHRVDNVAGFDLSPFNGVVSGNYSQTDLARYDWRPLSAPVEIFSFDFTDARPGAAETSRRLTPNADGAADAIAFWFRLALDDRSVIDTGPGAAPTHWKQAVHTLATPVALKRNEPARLIASHDGRMIRLELAR